VFLTSARDHIASVGGRSVTCTSVLTPERANVDEVCEKARLTGAARTTRVCDHRSSAAVSVKSGEDEIACGVSVRLCLPLAAGAEIASSAADLGVGAAAGELLPVAGDRRNDGDAVRRAVEAVDVLDDWDASD
jgi:hypothetical protein